MSGMPSVYVTNLQSLVAIGIVEVEISFHFVRWSSNVTQLKGHVVISIGGPQVKGVYNLPSLVAQDTVVVEI